MIQPAVKYKEQIIKLERLNRDLVRRVTMLETIFEKENDDE